MGEGQVSRVAPDTLPADFFSKPQTMAPDTLPADFFSKSAPPPTMSKADVYNSVQNASTVKPLMPQTATDWIASAKNLATGIAEGINPLPALQALYQHPIDTIKGLTAAQGAEATKAQDAYKKGNYSEALGHTLAYVLPLVGPAAANAGETIGRGEVARGVGQGIGMIAPSVIHMAGDLVKGRQIVPSMITKNPVDAAAVRYGMDEGLPVDAATATGNPAVRGTQWLADRSIGGSIANTGRSADAATVLSSKLNELANPSGPSITPEQAGSSLQDSLQKTIESHASSADAAYSKLRAIEADPANMKTVQTGTKTAATTLQDLAKPDYGSGKPATIPVNENIPLAADTRAAKTALAPILEQIKRQMPITQQSANPGLKALENIVNGPDFAPASQVDADLGAIKAIARGTQDNGLRNVGQGLAAKAVKELSDSVTNAVAQGGPDAVAALQAGREATKAKYAVADVAQTLRDEPVQTMRQLTAPADSGIEKLRAVAQHAPNEMPKIGSAFLNDILDTSTADGGFSRAQGAAAKWQRLGPETKNILFKDPKYISDLDNFFTLSKRLAENPNPSGSGYTAALTAQLATPLVNPIAAAITQASGYAMSKLLHSPSVVRVLVDGLKMSAKVPNTAAGTFAIMKAVNLLKAAGKSASEDSPSPQSGPLIAAPAW